MYPETVLAIIHLFLFRATTDRTVDWTREFRNNAMHTTVHLERWFVITTGRARRLTDDLIKSLQRAAGGMAMTLSNPKVWVFYTIFLYYCPFCIILLDFFSYLLYNFRVELPDDRVTTISKSLQECANKNPQMIMCIVSNNNSDRYSVIKKRCYVDFGIPSQVVVQKTITPKDPSKGPAGLMSVATKVAIQMNCKRK